MLAATEGELSPLAERLAGSLSAVGVRCRVVDAGSAVGGGTFPEVELPSKAVEISGPGATELARALRDGDPPVIGRILDDRLVLDLRTVLPGQEADVVRRVREALTTASPS
jgi:L-seryl-tRNA(Ser) seleniumtransferase